MEPKHKMPMEEKEEAAPHVAEKQCQQQCATVPTQEHFIGAEPQCKRPVEEEEAENGQDANENELDDADENSEDGEDGEDDDIPILVRHYTAGEASVPDLERQLSLWPKKVQHCHGGDSFPALGHAFLQFRNPRAMQDAHLVLHQIRNKCTQEMNRLRVLQNMAIFFFCLDKQDFYNHHFFRQ